MNTDYKGSFGSSLQHSLQAGVVGPPGLAQSPAVPGGGALSTGQETGLGLQLGLRKFAASFYSSLGLGQALVTAFSFFF